MIVSRSSFLLVFAAVALGTATGCTTISPPFNQMKGAQMTVYRLQDYVPAATPAASATSPLGALPIPPQIQQWITAGASLIPPSLLPPGLLPGTGAPPAVPDSQRFPPSLGAQGFPILAYQQVTDASVANDILETLGSPSDFQQPTMSCMYAEIGIAIAQQGNPQPANFLVSLSCKQVQAYNIQWPYPNTGLTDGGEKRFVSIVERVFAGR